MIAQAKDAAAAVAPLMSVRDAWQYVREGLQDAGEGEPAGSTAQTTATPPVVLELRGDVLAACGAVVLLDVRSRQENELSSELGVHISSK